MRRLWTLSLHLYKVPKYTCKSAELCMLLWKQPIFRVPPKYRTHRRILLQRNCQRRLPLTKLWPLFSFLLSELPEYQGVSPDWLIAMSSVLSSTRGSLYLNSMPHPLLPEFLLFFQLGTYRPALQVGGSGKQLYTLCQIDLSLLLKVICHLF